MKTVLLTMIIAVGAVQATVEDTLAGMERAWCAALVKKDAAALESILADDFTGVGSGGTTSTKAAQLSDVKAGGVRSCVHDNIKVRLYGDTAVLTGHTVLTGTGFNNRQVLWTDTFVKRNGRWQCVASHSTLAAGPK